MINEKLTIEEKERIKQLMCDFINSLSETDVCTISGKSETDTFTGKGKQGMFVMAEKKV